VFCAPSTLIISQSNWHAQLAQRRRGSRLMNGRVEYLQAIALWPAPPTSINVCNYLHKPQRRTLMGWLGILECFPPSSGGLLLCYSGSQVSEGSFCCQTFTQLTRPNCHATGSLTAVVPVSFRSLRSSQGGSSSEQCKHIITSGTAAQIHLWPHCPIQHVDSSPATWLATRNACCSSLQMPGSLCWGASSAYPR